MRPQTGNADTICSGFNLDGFDFRYGFGVSKIVRPISEKALIFRRGWMSGKISLRLHQVQQSCSNRAAARLNSRNRVCERLLIRPISPNKTAG
jgi:hypothetical protein